MNKIKKYLLIITIVLIIVSTQKVKALQSISINEGDYELVCRYDGGLTLTISKEDVYIQNSSLSINSTSSHGIEVFLTAGQRNSASTYRHQAITENGRCPSKLYAYELPEMEEEMEDEKNAIVTLYYSTSPNAEADVGGTRIEKAPWYTFGFGSDEVVNNATKKPDLDTKLVSEEVYLTTPKETTVCDYKIEETGSVMTIYMYNNITIIEKNGYATTAPWVMNDCRKDSRGNNMENVYVNDPVGQSVAGGMGTKYNYLRYYVDSSIQQCNQHNDGKKCVTYQYLGTRNGPPGDGTDNELCKVLGNKTVRELQKIIDIMQIIVPVLMIALTGFDIGKLVISGNLDEELPKKKTIIIVRFCILVLFFFLPLITNLIIDGLMDAGVVGIKEIDCVIGSR